MWYIIFWTAITMVAMTIVTPGLFKKNAKTKRRN